MAIEDSSFGIKSITLRDNSIRTVETTSKLSLLPSLHPVFSSDGPDNELSEESSMSTIYEKYGEDFTDITKYGQQNLNVQKVLEGGSSAYLCRLLPEDAKRAHLVVCLAIKENSAIPLYKRDAFGELEIGEDGLPVKITHEDKGAAAAAELGSETEGPEGQQTVTTKPSTVSGIQCKIVIKTIEAEDGASLRSLQSKGGAVIDGEDGFKLIPLMFVSYYANGSCGNDYGLRIINDFARDGKVNDGRRYQLFLVKKTPSGAMTLPIGDGLSFAFNPNAKISKTSDAIESLQKVYPNYNEMNQKKQMNIEVYTENYSVLEAEISKILKKDLIVDAGEGFDETKLRTPKTVNDVDFINGYDKDGYKYDNVYIDTTLKDYVNIAEPQYLQGGSDGKFETLKDDPDGLKKERNLLLTKFFNGDIDKKNILNVLKCDAGIMFDANYDSSVKLAMLNLLKWRRDICCVFDCGFTETLGEAINAAKLIKQSVNEGGENYAIVPHCGITVDRDVNVRVTGTYEFAYGLMNLYRSKPFAVYAGKPEDNGCVRRTIFDWVVEETKPKGYEEKLAKENKLYWAVDLGKAVGGSIASGNMTGRNVYFYSNANLYYEPVSKLAEFRNGLLVNDIRRVLKLVLVKYTFDTNGAESSISKASNEMKDIIRARYPSNVSITANLFQTDRDKLLNQATCEVSVFFPDIFETWNCVIIADRQA